MTQVKSRGKYVKQVYICNDYATMIVLDNKIES